MMESRVIDERKSRLHSCVKEDKRLKLKEGLASQIKFVLANNFH